MSPTSASGLHHRPALEPLPSSPVHTDPRAVPSCPTVTSLSSGRKISENVRPWAWSVPQVRMYCTDDTRRAPSVAEPRMVQLRTRLGARRSPQVRMCCMDDQGARARTGSRLATSLRARTAPITAPHCPQQLAFGITRPAGPGRAALPPAAVVSTQMCRSIRHQGAMSRSATSGTSAPSRAARATPRGHEIRIVARPERRGVDPAQPGEIGAVEVPVHALFGGDAGGDEHRPAAIGARRLGLRARCLGARAEAQDHATPQRREAVRFGVGPGRSRASMKAPARRMSRARLPLVEGCLHARRIGPLAGSRFVAGPGAGGEPRDVVRAASLRPGARKPFTAEGLGQAPRSRWPRRCWGG